MSVADKLDCAAVETDVSTNLNVAGFETEELGVVGLKPDFASGLDSPRLHLCAAAAEAFLVGGH